MRKFHCAIVDSIRLSTAYFFIILNERSDDIVKIRTKLKAC